jgi:uroporphyrinogen-III synthase
VRAGTPIALELARAFGITSFLAVGRKSQEALARVGLDAVPVRHPAQGGSRIFARQLAAFNASA